MTATSTDFDFDVRYRVEDWDGIAWNAVEWETEPLEPEWVWVCPKCDSPCWDGPHGHKLAKCWDCDLAFDTVFDTDEEAEAAGFWDDHEDETRRTGRIVCVMVGDDSRFTFEPDQLTPLDEDEYCPGCGQIGCGWGH